MIFFSDLDGTFMTSTKQIHPQNARALDAIAEAGMQFVPCTGRPAHGIDREILRHPACRFAISANGAAVHELDGERPEELSRARLIYSTPLARDSARAIWQIARGHDVTFDIFADGATYAWRPYFERLPEFIHDPYMLAGMKSSRTPVDQEPGQMIEQVTCLERVAMYWKDPVDRDQIVEALKTVPGIEVTRSFETNIEVMQAGTSKGAALTWLCEHLGMRVKDSVAFGDNMNDVEMLEEAGLGVAMENAEDQIKQHADAIARTNDEGGVGRAILGLLAVRG